MSKVIIQNQAFLLCIKVCNHITVLNREHLLLHAEDGEPDLQMLLKLIDLLASCSEGENLFIESICQNIISINELLKVFND